MGIFGDARRGMDAQSLVHVIVTMLVILGNVALFASGGPRAAGGGPAAVGGGKPGEAKP